MSNTMKPITVARQEFIQEMQELINDCPLPYFVIESILKDLFNFKRLMMPLYVRQQLENLAAENTELRQQVVEQANALIELAEMCVAEEEAVNNG